MKGARVLVALHESGGIWSYTLVYPSPDRKAMYEDAVSWFASASSAVTAAAGHLQRLADEGLTTLEEAKAP